MATHTDLPNSKPMPKNVTANPGTSSSIGNASNQNLIAAVSYIGFGILSVAILLLEKDNKYIRFHAMQSTLFYVAIFIIRFSSTMIPLGVLGFWLGQFITGVGAIVLIVLLYKAYIGEEYELPAIGQLAKSQI